MTLSKQQPGSLDDKINSEGNEILDKRKYSIRTTKKPAINHSKFPAHSAKHCSEYFL